MINNYPYTNFHELNLDWMLDKMKEISNDIDTVNAWRDEWTDKLEGFDADIDELNNKYSQLEADFTSFIYQVNADFQQLSNNLDARFNEQENRINIQFLTQKQEISNRINEFESQVNSTLLLMNTRINEMDLRLNNVLNNLLDNVLMINPFTGLKESVVNVINQLASLHMIDGINASEYDALELTASVYDGKELTATEYDFNAKNLLP